MWKIEALPSNKETTGQDASQEHMVPGPQPTHGADHRAPASNPVDRADPATGPVTVNTAEPRYQNVCVLSSRFKHILI